MAELIDRDATRRRLDMMRAAGEVFGGDRGNFPLIHAVLDAAMEAVEQMPTIEAVSVVRCKDCYLGDTEGSFTPGMVYCDHFDQGVGPNFFCMCGKPRMDADAPERAGGDSNGEG